MQEHKCSLYLLLVAASAVVFFLASASSQAAERTTPSECTYNMALWNVNRKGSVNRQSVRHSYSDLAPDEVDSVTGCTVCKEDQERIEIPPLRPFSVCFKLAPRVRSVLKFLIERGEPVYSVIGYRVIKSRGPLDPEGNRTEFSNHSFGAAIDINPEQNGLYDNCIEFGPGCRLLRGGDWRPGAPGTLEKNSDIVVRFKQQGFKWGGEIAGRQKDFMHFSMTGY